MAEALTVFLRENAALPFVWGERDCCLFSADWVLRCRGIDPAKSLRGAYSGRSGALRVVLAAGGLLPLVSLCMAQARLRETVIPQLGAIGVVETDTPLRMATAICLEERGWALKSPDGIVVGRFPLLKAWRV